MTIDVDTLVFLEWLAGAELTLVLLLVGRLLRGEPGLLPWVLAMASATAGSLATTLGTGEAIAEVAGAMLLSLAPALVWLGARDRCGLQRRTLPIGIVLAAVGAIVAIDPGEGSAERVPALAAAGWSAAIVWTLVRGAPSSARAGTGAAAALFALHGGFQLARAFFPPAGEAEPLLGLRDWPKALSAMGAIFFAVAWSFAVLGLIGQRLLAKLRGAARTDDLTGLPNRLAFIEDAASALEFCRRRRRPCAVVLADLDHFKRLNDTRGHAAGDRALRRFADAAGRAAGKGIVLGRYGGEEFGAVLPGADAEQARSWAERLRAQVEADGPVTASFGIAVGVGGALDLEQLVARADEALYRAKAEGRNRVCLAASPSAASTGT